MALKRVPKKEVETPAVETQAVETPEEVVERSIVESKAKSEGAGLAAVKRPVIPGMALENLKDSFVVDFGTLDRLKSGQGIIVDQDGKSLGRWVDVQVVSYNSHWTISPNDDAAPDDVVRFSLDNKTIDGSPDITVGECLSEMKKSWPKAGMKEYYEVVGVILNSEEPTDLCNKAVQIQLSPTSRQSFTNYQIQVPIQRMMGTLPEDTDVSRVRFTATSKTGKNKNYTQLAASATPA